MSCVRHHARVLFAAIGDSRSSGRVDHYDHDIFHHDDHDCALFHDDHDYALFHDDHHCILFHDDHHCALLHHDNDRFVYDHHDRSLHDHHDNPVSRPRH